MAIDRTGVFPNQSQAIGNKTNTTAERSNSSVQQLQPAASKTRVDTITLTTQADQLKSIKEDLRNQSVIDGARIETLKSAIDAGSYTINPLSVAEKFIQFESSFFEDNFGNNAAGTLRP